MGVGDVICLSGETITIVNDEQFSSVTIIMYYCDIATSEAHLIVSSPGAEAYLFYIPQVFLPAALSIKMNPLSPQEVPQLF